MSNILLSICIPTFKRSDLLFVNLNQIYKQLNTLPEGFSLEIIIQDNNSEDDTINIVKKFTQLDTRFKFFTNHKNIGPELNFELCLERSIGKYIWVLSDDDYILDNRLLDISNILLNIQPDFVYMNNYWYEDEPKFNFITNNNLLDFREYNNNEEFLINVNYWITFISGGIFNRLTLGKNFDSKKYLGSNLIHVYWFLTAIINSKKSIYIDSTMIACKSNNHNINYNIFDTFCKNFRNILINTFNELNVNKNVLSKIDSIMLANFLPNYVLNYRVNKSDSENKMAFEILYQQYYHKIEYWLLILPMTKLPILLTKIYINLILKLKSLTND